MGKNLIWRSLIKKYWTISIKFQIHISNLIPKFYCNNKALLNQTFFERTYSNLTSFSFSKNIKVLQWLLKSKCLFLMTKVNPNNGNETKSENFLWSLFKFDVIFSLTKKTLEYFNYFQSLKWKWNKIRHFSNIFKYFSHSNLTLFFIVCKILEYFSEFFN